MFNAKTWVGEKQIFLNSSTWKFNKEETECALRNKEKLRAFNDPMSNTICLKFVVEKTDD